MNFNYLAIPQCDASQSRHFGWAAARIACRPSDRSPGTFANDPSLRMNSNTAFGEDDEARLPPDGGFHLGRL